MRFVLTALLLGSCATNKDSLCTHQEIYTNFQKFALESKLKMDVNIEVCLLSLKDRLTVKNSIRLKEDNEGDCKSFPSVSKNALTYKISIPNIRAGCVIEIEDIKRIKAR